MKTSSIKIFLLWILVLNLASNPAISQTKRKKRQQKSPFPSLPVLSPEKKVGGAEIYYFKDTDETQITTFGNLGWGEKATALMFSITITGKGNKVTKSEYVVLGFYSSSESRVLATCKTLSIHSGGMVYEWDIWQYRAPNKTRHEVEVMFFLMEYPDFEKVAKDTNLTIELDNKFITTQGLSKLFQDVVRALDEQ